ncbi:hypothetical protein [Amycolatopsis sp. lyj-84]|uniref:hypothetical protein n=1 Tax=Amycolatopsis sp. lyj-84 TaxID=2789284 RepID=UPI00397918A4
MSYLGDDENGNDPAVVEHVDGLCRKCGQEVTNLTIEEAESWEDEHRRTCVYRNHSVIP